MAEDRPGEVGHAFWALAPYAPAAPFRLYPGPGEHEPIEVVGVAELLAAARHGGDAELTVLMRAKLRPVLIVAAAQDSYADPAFLALRLHRFDKLTPAEQDQVRAQRHPRLFHLKPSRFQGLPQENAALLSDLVRVAQSALDVGRPLGELNSNELRVLHQRLAAYYQLDLTILLKRLSQAGRPRGTPDR